MKKNIIKNFPEFTHFASLPFIRKEHRIQVSALQQKIVNVFKKYNLNETLKANNPYLFHITLSMLTLPQQKVRQSLVEILKNLSQVFVGLLSQIQVKLTNIKYFTRFNKQQKMNQVTVIYLQLQDNQANQKISKALDLLIRTLIKQQIINQQQLKSMRIHYDHKQGIFKPEKLHVTLFRVNGLFENQQFLQIYTQLKDMKLQFKFDCDYFDISTRFHYDETKFYQPLYRIQLNRKQN